MDPIIGLGIVLLLTIAFAYWISRGRGQKPAAHTQTQSPVENLPSGIEATLLAESYVPPVEIACIQGPLEGQRFAFKRAWLRIGRQPDNDIVIPGSLVSRHHAILTATSSSITLKDLESTNGTWISGQQIDTVELAEKQPFQIGPCVFAWASFGQSVTPVSTPNVIEQAAMVSPPASSVIRSLEIQNYDQLQVLGGGGAATVYLCRERATGNLVAIKVLHHSADPYFKQKFEHEGKLGLHLQHPHIIQVLGVNSANGLHYIVMEYLAGGSLRDLMQRTGLAFEQSIQITGQICLALEYAHKQGVFHRDLKPENILFTDNWVAKLADFGIARLTSLRTVTQEGMLVGTPDYMSYEQAKGADIDGRSDQYSLAIVLYECLTGTRPFTGEPLSVVGQHLSTKPTAPRSINSAIPKKIDRAIMKALEKDRNKRFKNMLEMAEAIGYQPDAAAAAATTAPPQPSAYEGAVSGARLVHLASGTDLSLNAGSVTIGRGSFQPEQAQISRQHARIWFDNGSYMIEDLGSLNGTFVNGVAATQPVPLASGSYVYLGPVQFQFWAE